MSTPGADQQSREPAAKTKVKPRRTASWSVGARLLARRLHFVAGVVVAPFLLVLCLTGLVYVFSPQIHDDLYRSQLHVPGQAGAPRPVSEQVQAALTAHPEGSLQAVYTAPAADRTTRVVLSVPGLTGTGDAAQARSVFVDPYTNYITGELTTVGDQLPANTWLRQLHSNLHLGEVGRIYAELAASWLPVIAVGGLVLLLAKQGRRRASAREVLVPSTRRAKEGWARLRGVHGPLGLWLTIGLLVVSVTGLAMSQFAGGRGDQATNPLRLRAPVLAAAPVPVPPNVERIGVDHALQIARDGGLNGPLLVTAPSGEGTVYTVAERAVGLPLHLSSIAIDPYTAQVTERIGWDDYSVAAKLTTLGAEFHTGALFGLANQIIVALMAAGFAVLILLGYRMWWIKNPYKSKWAAVPPPTWRQLPLPALSLVLLAVAALSWLMPVFGASLLVFAAIDAMINAMKRRRPIPSPRRR